MPYVPGEKSKIGDDDKTRQQSQRTRELPKGVSATIVIPPYTSGGKSGKMVFNEGILVSYQNPT
jgi:hypothetical protein